VGPLVVVEDDDQALGPGDGNMVEGLVGHATREGTVTDDGHGPAGVVGEGVAQGVAEGRGGVAVLDEVVGRLGPARIAGEPTRVPESVEVGGAAGEDLVDVCLMPDVPDETVLRRVERAMQGDRQLDHSEVRGEMAAGHGDLLEDELPDLL